MTALGNLRNKLGKLTLDAPEGFLGTVGWSAAALILMWTTLVLAIFSTHQQRIQAEIREGEETLKILAEITQEALNTSEQLLKTEPFRWSSVALIPDVETTLNDDERLERMLTAWQLRLPPTDFLAEVFVIDAAGALTSVKLGEPPKRFQAPRIDFSARPSQDSQSPQIVLLPPNRSGIHGSIALARRVPIRGDERGLAGVSLQADWFGKRFQQFRMGTAGSSVVGALVHLDTGVVLARAGMDGAITSGQSVEGQPTFEMVRSASRGHFERVSPIDGIDRITVFRRLDNWPVALVWAESREAALADWRTFRATVLVLGLVVTLLLIFHAWQTLRLLQRNRASEIKARAADQAKSLFLSNIAHELRTPLTGILGFAEIIERHAQVTRWTEPARRIRRNAERLNQLLNNVLDLSRLEIDHLPIHPRPERLRPLMFETIELYDAAAALKGLALSLEVDPSVPELISCDATRLRQILGNLIANAIKFTDHGSVRVNVSCQAGDVCFDVIDTGPGIPAHLQESVFERFRQVSLEPQRRQQGAGLGLALARAMAQSMNGSLLLRSEFGHGCAFSLRLPVGPIR